jgi:uncharacterized protein YjiS (DUF1127 family)
MAFLQSHRDNIIWLGKLSRPPPSMRWIGRACNILAPVLRQFESLAAKSKQRRVRARLLSAQRARQRRVLARLSPRELSEIGLSRHDAEIGLR